jgi:hypothetical protein
MYSTSEIYTPILDHKTFDLCNICSMDVFHIFLHDLGNAAEGPIIARIKCYLDEMFRDQ